MRDDDRKKMIFNCVKRTLMSPFVAYRKGTKKSSYFANDKGQAVVEYLLIAFVTITLVLALATKLVPQVNTFVKNYAGAYVECLLETGELPATSFNPNPNTECSIEAMQASGRIAPPSNSSVGGTGSGGSGAQGGAESGQNNSNQNASGRGSRDGSSNGSNNSPQLITAGNYGADSTSGRSSRTGGASSSETASAAGSDRNNASGGSSIRNPYANLQDNGRGISGAVPVPLTNARISSDVKQNLKTGIKKDPTIGGEHLRKGSFSTKVSKGESIDPDTLQTTDVGFNFGLYLRYFLIGGILLALFIMVATQLNSLRKSWGTA